jgi:protoheme IX farnesyltransferase
MYREDYARGGIRITATVPDTSYAARSTAVQAVFYAVLMIGAALWPFALGTAGYLYAVAATVLSLGYLWYSIRFAAIVRSPDLHDTQAASHREPARRLLHASIVFLPLLLGAMMLDAHGRLMF